VVIKIPPKEMRSTIKAFAHLPLKDIECFERIVAFVEALDDEGNIRARAIAWASGDVDGLSRSTGLPQFNNVCTEALASSEAAEPYEIGDVHERARSEWLRAVENAIANNETTLTVLPIDEILSATGRLEALRAKGYRIEEPTR
jgi:hypothetical protein